MLSYLALYRKYRPIDFDDVYGQENVVRVIKNAIASDKISHAYLFCGPRGTGKTTIAKIIARIVNCDNLVDGKPCGKCYNCLNFLNSNDIVEIDAASNNGVDEIRELRDKINLVPSNARYKVYIIDEVHMLTTQAFNALLKTLEEPPAHVIFILATTEPHKIPLTIVSRCQKFSFSRIDDKLIVDRLKEIAKKEKIVINDDALFEIARLSEGGLRDAINILDQLVAYSNSNITLDDIYRVNGSVSYSDLCKLLKYIAENDKVNMIEFVDKIDRDGKDINKFIEELVIFLKDVILYKCANLLSNIDAKNEAIKVVSEQYDNKKIYDLIDTLNMTQNSIKLSMHSAIIFLTSILRFSEENHSEHVENISREIIEHDDIHQDEVLNNQKGNISTSEDKSKELSISKTNIDIRVNNALAGASKNILNEIKSKWINIDDFVYVDRYNVVVGLLKDSNPVVASSQYVIIANRYDSSVDRINKNIDIIQELFKKIFGYDMLIVSVTNARWDIIKNKYIDDTKKGVKYTVKDFAKEDFKEDDKSPIEDLIDLVGDNVIEYK